MNVFSIVLYSETRDRFYEAVTFAAAARARGSAVLIFLRGPALRAFVENQWAAAPDTAIEKGLNLLPAGPEDMLAEIRAMGKVQVYACSAWVRILKLDSPKTASRVDAVIGLNMFLTQSDGGSVLFV
ncbi:MAG: hypothetical protein HY548_00745 [Elusimicrobia bacterium]|nr:hypothetical protein [Elusimicrobiota bacterium]